MNDINAKHNKYIEYLSQNGPCKTDIIDGVDRPLKYIKTGEVDMAGPLWPHKDDCELMIGGYSENRIIGATDSHVPMDEMRTMHIGLDFFAGAGTKIFAPLGGKIHSFRNNDNPRDYGPTIILEHEISEDFSFFTLYGHLSLESIEGLKIGDYFKAGTEIARFGGREENGGWPPHLHFQIILDMLGRNGDFFGLCAPKKKEYWLKLCPSPIEFLGLKIAN